MHVHDLELVKTMKMPSKDPIEFRDSTGMFAYVQKAISFVETRAEAHIWEASLISGWDLY